MFHLGESATPLYAYEHRGNANGGLGVVRGAAEAVDAMPRGAQERRLGVMAAPSSRLGGVDDILKQREFYLCIIRLARVGISFAFTLELLSSAFFFTDLTVARVRAPCLLPHTCKG